MVHIRVVGPDCLPEDKSSHARAIKTLADVAGLSVQDARVVFRTLLEAKLLEVLIPTKTVEIAERKCKALLAAYLEAEVVRGPYDRDPKPAQPGSGRRIRDTSKKALRINITTPKARRIDPEVVREALGAERVGRVESTNAVWAAWAGVRAPR